MNVNNLFTKSFEWKNREHFLNLLPHLSQVKFALFCAEQVKHLIKDKRSLKAIEITRLFLEGKATKEDCGVAAANAAYAANAAAYADAYTAAYAANAAAAAAYTAAYADAYTAANAAAAAAAAAADAADASKDEVKQAQMNFLRKLIISSLSEEDKSCWLLVVSV